jgi:hypothetical protein
MTTMLSLGILLLLLWGIIFWIKKITKTPVTQNQQGGGNQNTPQNQPGTQGGGNQQNQNSNTARKKIPLWNMVIGTGIIVLVLGLLMRMNKPYSEEVILQSGKSYSFTSSWEDVQISPQYGCVNVIFPNQKQFSVCANTPIDVGNTGSGNHTITATENNQMIVVTRIPSTIGRKFIFWINPTNWNLLFN